MNLHRRASMVLVVLMIGLCCGLAPRVLACHPFHVCVGQMQYNPQSSRWEVSLRMHPRDLELALSEFHRKNISREEEGFPKYAIDYLENQFFLVCFPGSQDIKSVGERISAIPPLRSLEEKEFPEKEFSAESSGGADREDRSRLEWVGIENQRGWVWIHLELIPPKQSESKGSLYLVHRIFLDRIEQQENSVAILATRTDRSSLQFKKGKAVQAFVSPTPNR